MTSEAGYDYRELAYDLYKEGNDLLNKLVEIRTSRNMTQEQLADEMNVSQAYISKIENGQAQLVTLLTNYALEAGARIHYEVEKAEVRAKGDRAYQSFSFTSKNKLVTTWESGEITVSSGTTKVTHTVSNKQTGGRVENVEAISSERRSDEHSVKSSIRIGGLANANW